MAGQIKTDEEEIANQIKTQQARAVQLFESVHLQSFIVFDINNEPTLSFDISSLLNINTAYLSRSIALNFLACIIAHI